MPLPASWVAQHTSNTSGTGTLTLNAASASRRSFSVSAGVASRAVRYSLRVPNSLLWEIGDGIFNGGNPGTLTRVTVIASSNANALVSFIGTIDVILTTLPGQRELTTFAAGTTLTVANLGDHVTYTGASSATFTLPAAAAVPLGSGYIIQNTSSAAGAVLTIDGNGAELVGPAATLLLYAGETTEIWSTGTAWRAVRPPSLSRAENVAKAWAIFNGTALTDSYGISGVADHGVGDFTLTFTTPFATANYAIIATASTQAGYGAITTLQPRADTGQVNANSARLNCHYDVNASGVILLDASMMCVAFFGDQ